jgi:DNA polymerase-3 subunit delta'
MIIGHQKQWQFLTKKNELGQLGHAYLFVGSDRIGKKFFAKEFIKYVNCLESSLKKQSCQKCVNCLMIEKNIFPDFKILASKNKKDFLFGDGGEIKISQIREVQKFLNYKSYYGRLKSVIVDDAQNMNQEAQSCFLKTLEEPKGKTVLFLITSKPDMILPTIISRCQTVKFFKSKDLPADEQKEKRDKEIFENLMRVINSGFSERFKYVKNIDFAKQNPSEIIEIIQRYLRHLLLIKSGIIENKNKDNLFEEKIIYKDYSASKIKEIINLTEEINNKLLFTNSNPKLGLEILLMEL